MNPIKLNGRKFPQQRFCAYESDNQPDNEVVMSVLLGLRPACIIRDALTQEQSAALANAYLDQSAQRRHDGVPAYEIGLGSYGLTPDDYFSRVPAARADMEAIYAAAGVHLPSMAQEILQATVDPGVVVRPARHGGRAAMEFRATHFVDEGPLALKAHEDRGQTDGYEFGAAHRVCGFNFYVLTPDDQEGAALRMWNIVPDARTKRALGVEKTGYPYPTELLADTPFIDIRPRAGDLLLFAADGVHAVTSSKAASKARIVFQSFAGMIGSQIVRWT